MQAIKLGRQPTEVEVNMEVKAMKRKEAEERKRARQVRVETREVSRMEELESMYVSQDKRLKKVEDLLKELKETMARIALQPQPTAPKQKRSVKSVGRVQPTRTTDRAPLSQQAATTPPEKASEEEEEEIHGTEATETAGRVDSASPVEKAREERTVREDAGQNRQGGRDNDSEREEDVYAGIPEGGELEKPRFIALDEAPNEDADSEDTDTIVAEGSAPDEESDGTDGPKEERDMKVSSTPEVDEQGFSTKDATMSPEKVPAEEVRPYLHSHNALSEAC